MAFLSRATRNTLLFLALVTFLVYLPSLGNKFVWDDEQFIYNNTYVKNFQVGKIFTENTIAGAGELSNFYRPLTSLTFAIDHALWGLNPIGFHLTNTLLHIGAGLCLFGLFKLLKLTDRLSFWLALFFLLHPLQTEAVTYVNSRGDSLFAFLGLAGLVSFAASFDSTYRRYQPYLLLISVLTFVLSILSKELGLAVAGLYGLVLLWQWLTTSKPTLKKLTTDYRPQLLTFIILGVLAGGYLYLRSTHLNFLNSFNFYTQENIYTSNLTIRLATFSKVFWIYLRLLVWPYPLHMERTTTLITSLINPWLGGLLLLLLVVLAIGWREYQQTKKPLIWLGLAWFLVMIAPVSGLIPVNGLLYEHWLYLPGVGFWLVVVGLLRMANGRYLHLSLAGWESVGMMVVTVWIALTIRQNYLWGNPVRFYEYTLQFAQSTRLFNNLGMAYDEAGDYELAIGAYQKSMIIDPQRPHPHHNAGLTYINMNRLDLAEQELVTAIKLDPRFVPTYSYLFQLYLWQKKFVPAQILLDQLKQVTSNDPQLNEWQTELERTQKASLPAGE